MPVERLRSLPGLAWCMELPPAAGGAVMAPGILSVGLHLIGREVLSLAALAVSGLLWLLLGLAFACRLVCDRPRFRAASYSPAALTAVAATGVLGSRISMLGRQTAAIALLVLAAALWPWLTVGVVRHWQRHMAGGVFLVCVATQGLAVLAATLALALPSGWLARAALAAFCLGLVCYGDALARFDLREVVRGAGDHWVAGGALAISALAASKLTAVPWTGPLHTALRWATLVTLALALAWYVLLLAAELRSWRPHYDIRRWATVFPLGMTATACLSAAGPTGVGVLFALGEALLWIAVGAWLLTFVAFAVSRRRAR
ncbi:tellurite resistance/C4-dicarboxylate transporter family protein [Streptomyces sp. NPDC101206]|uniref:tellurite resistance/C4-dicarboxylate transporter family protein n=1 Tax=Streptomyces sp. NPDC101206 TaxID=3366128 RepID=UPI003829C48D